MNILENHIIKIHSEKPMTKDCVEVDITTDYYGILVRETKVFQKDKWKEIKKLGYYL